MKDKSQTELFQGGCFEDVAFLHLRHNVLLYCVLLCQPEHDISTQMRGRPGNKGRGFGLSMDNTQSSLFLWVLVMELIFLKGLSQ